VADEDWLLNRERIDGFIRARLTMLPTSEDTGRRTPILSGYRSSWDIGNMWEGQPTVNDAPLLIEDQDSVHPGAQAVVRLHPLAPEFWADLTTGQRISAYEGSRLVATAEVLEIVGPAA
jgi:hypothetical protein